MPQTQRKKVQSGGVDIGEDGEEPLREGEEALAMVNGLAQLQVGSSLGSLTRDDERRWRNPFSESTRLCICNQEERTTNNAMIGVVEERMVEERSEEMSEEEDEVNNTSLERISIPRSPTTSS
jgi:hypothetical protein